MRRRVIMVLSHITGGTTGTGAVTVDSDFGSGGGASCTSTKF